MFFVLKNTCFKAVGPTHAAQVDLWSLCRTAAPHRPLLRTHTLTHTHTHTHTHTKRVDVTSARGCQLHDVILTASLSLAHALINQHAEETFLIKKKKGLWINLACGNKAGGLFVCARVCVCRKSSSFTFTRLASECGHTHTHNLHPHF